MELRSTAVDDFVRGTFTFDVVESSNLENCPFEILCDEPNVYQPEIINPLKPNAKEYFNYALDLPLSWTLSRVQNPKKLPERYTREERRTRILRYQEKKQNGTINERHASACRYLCRQIFAQRRPRNHGKFKALLNKVVIF
jgi:hypothetical protein